MAYTGSPQRDDSPQPPRTHRSNIRIGAGLL